MKNLKSLAISLFMVLGSNAQNIKVAETVMSSDEVRAGNMAYTSTDRLFVSINPLMGADARVYEVMEDGSHKPYPNNTYSKGVNSKIKAIIGIRTDSQDNLWLLDMGAQQFVVWDTKNEKLLKTVAIPNDVVKPTSFLQDFVIDEKNEHIIIADMTQGDLKSAPESAFIVIDMMSGKARRMAQNHASMMPDIDGGFALNPIAIDPKFKWVYFGALNGKTVYRVAAKKFKSEKALSAGIKAYATKSYSDGIAVDNNGNVYVTNIEKNELGVTNSKDGYRTIATLPKGQSWPDGLWIKDGYLYSTVDQLNRVPAMNNNKDDSKGPFIIVRTPLVE